MLGHDTNTRKLPVILRPKSQKVGKILEKFDPSKPLCKFRSRFVLISTTTIDLKSVLLLNLFQLILKLASPVESILQVKFSNVIFPAKLNSIPFKFPTKQRTRRVKIKCLEVKF